LLLHTEEYAGSIKKGMAKSLETEAGKKKEEACTGTSARE